MKKPQVLFITQTALMLAILIAMQFLTRSFGQLGTGIMVNLILLISVFVIGLKGGLVVGLVSPFLANLIGIGPAFIQIVFFIAIANALLITVAWLLARKTIYELVRYRQSLIALLIAAIVKTTFLWVGLVKIALPLIPGLQEVQIKLITASFTWPQLITATVGGIWAIVIVPFISKGVKK